MIHTNCTLCGKGISGMEIYGDVDAPVCYEDWLRDPTDTNPFVSIDDEIEVYEAMIEEASWERFYLDEDEDDDVDEIIGLDEQIADWRGIVQDLKRRRHDGEKALAEANARRIRLWSHAVGVMP